MEKLSEDFEKWKTVGRLEEGPYNSKYYQTSGKFPTIFSFNIAQSRLKGALRPRILYWDCKERTSREAFTLWPKK